MMIIMKRVTSNRVNCAPNLFSLGSLDHLYHYDDQDKHEHDKHDNHDKHDGHFDSNCELRHQKLGQLIKKKIELLIW